MKLKFMFHNQARTQDFSQGGEDQGKVEYVRVRANHVNKCYPSPLALKFFLFCLKSTFPLYIPLSSQFNDYIL